MRRNSEESFHAALNHARGWERALAAWVRARGWHVLPTYDFSGKGDDKAPVLLAPPGTADLIMPDLQCFRAGRVRWIECKWKTSAVLHRNSGQMVTGISLRLASHYERVRATTGADVWLVFLHEREREVRGGEMARLEMSHDYNGGVMCRGGMRFWLWDRLPLICSLDEIAERVAA